jgi:hypothetical protein
METEYAKPELKALREAMQTALDAAGIKGTIDVGNCSYSGGEATFKVKVTKEGAVSREKRMLELYAEQYNLDLNKIGAIHGWKVTLQGYNSKARKMPWQVGNASGDRQWKLTEDQVKRMFGGKEEK